VKKTLRFLVILVGILLAILLISPFLIPVPPLQGIKPVAELADEDSRFATIGDLGVHYKRMGEGGQVFILLHGFGASLFSWHAVMEPFSRMGTVIAYDRPAFGLTQRPMSWTGLNPYDTEAQVELLLGLMNHFSIQKAVLVGNSAGGTIAMLAALKYPERIQALILVDPAVYSAGDSNSWMSLVKNTPQMAHLGPLLMRLIKNWGPKMITQAWHDPSKITPETLEGYQKPLNAENWDKALWEMTRASSQSGLSGRLSELTLPVLVITGDDDRIVPTAQSIRLANELPDASLVVIANAGHVPHEEDPVAFMRAVLEFYTILNK
jgi:pimeloyl-ACP methyl ester carboxylesterase